MQTLSSKNILILPNLWNINRCIIRLMLSIIWSNAKPNHRTNFCFHDDYNRRQWLSLSHNTRRSVDYLCYNLIYRNIMYKWTRSRTIFTIKRSFSFHNHVFTQKVWWFSFQKRIYGWWRHKIIIYLWYGFNLSNCYIIDICRFINRPTNCSFNFMYQKRPRPSIWTFLSRWRHLTFITANKPWHNYKHI